MRGVHFVDIDEAANVVAIGVFNADDSTAVARAAHATDLQEGLVAIRVMPPVRPTTSLRDYLRPVIGGVQVVARDTVTGVSAGACSASVVARIGTWTTRYLLTASHCTPTHYGYDPASVLYQPFVYGTLRVGIEAMDPPPQYGPPMCPAGKLCRQSDVAVYALDDATTPFELAHTTWLSITPGVPGSLDVTTPAFNVTGVVPFSNQVVGQGLHHLGRTTGWSAGTIAQTCVSNLDVATGVWMMCDHSLRATSGTGDSGGPVFQWYGGATGYAVNIAGIGWGLGDCLYTDAEGQFIGTLTWFSPWQYITYDFGPLTPNP
jgi:hypothetical protein